MKSSERDKRIEWLLDHEEYWLNYQLTPPVLERLKNKMREAGLYDPQTKNHSMNPLPLIKAAKKKLSEEMGML